MRLAAQQHRRQRLRVELPLVPQRRRDQARGTVHLRLAGVLEQEEEVGVQRDPVAPAEIPVRPERVQPAVHAGLGVVGRQRRLQHPRRAVRPQEVLDRRPRPRQLLGGQQRPAPLQEPRAARLQRRQRHPRQRVLVVERPEPPLGLGRRRRLDRDGITGDRLGLAGTRSEIHHCPSFRAARPRDVQVGVQPAVGLQAARVDPGRHQRVQHLGPLLGGGEPPLPERPLDLDGLVP
jgi:hypothetical protein